MTAERDRLAALLHGLEVGCYTTENGCLAIEDGGHADDARHLIAAGVTFRADLAARWEEALATVYNGYGVAIAVLCDEHLDRSGALLGRVRERAVAIREAIDDRA